MSCQALSAELESRRAPARASAGRWPRGRLVEGLLDLHQARTAGSIRPGSWGSRSTRCEWSGHPCSSRSTMSRRVPRTSPAPVRRPRIVAVPPPPPQTHRVAQHLRHVARHRGSREPAPGPTAVRRGPSRPSRGHSRRYGRPAVGHAPPAASASHHSGTADRQRQSAAGAAPPDTWRSGWHGACATGRPCRRRGRSDSTARRRPAATGRGRKWARAAGAKAKRQPAASQPQVEDQVLAVVQPLGVAAGPLPRRLGEGHRPAGGQEGGRVHVVQVGQDGGAQGGLEGGAPRRPGRSRPPRRAPPPAPPSKGAISSASQAGVQPHAGVHARR